LYNTIEERKVYMGIVRDAYLRMVKENNAMQTKRHEISGRGETKRLWVSDLGRCRRKPFLRLAGIEETHSFDEYTLELFHSGKVWEAQLQRAFDSRLEGIAANDLQVKSDIWSGRIDMYLSATNTIVELKDTADHNFRARDRLPYVSHALQVLAYTRLLRQKWELDKYPDAVLYYHGRGSWAEMHLRQYDEGILYTGEKSGWDINGMLPYNVDGEMADFAGLWDNYQQHGEPPGVPYDSPFQERFGCTKAVKKLRYPACNYMGYCWPSLGNPPYNEEDYDEWETLSEET